MNMHANSKQTRYIVSNNLSFLYKAITILLLLFFIFDPSITKAQSNSINEIIVKGNERIESETILSIADLRKGESYSNTHLNNSLLVLKASKYFSSVNLKLDNNIIIIEVRENPTINSVNFEGNNIIKNDNLLELISTIERQTLSMSKIEQDADKIAYAYVKSGHLDAQVTPRIIEKTDNRIDLVFEIIEGKVTEIEKISFIGNRNFSDSRLRGVIATKQAGIFRNFFKSDTYIEDRIEYDKQLLREFYINRGFVNFNIKSSSAEMTVLKDAFLVSFSLEEGQKYKYGSIKILSPNTSINSNRLMKLNNIKINSDYDPRKLENFIEEIEHDLSKSGINFVDVSSSVLINDKDLKIDIVLNLVESTKTFVERIEVEGNSTTLDEVIRLKFDFVEGDPFDLRKVQEASDRIRGLGFFSEVNITSRTGSSPEKIIIKVKLIEKATGSLGIGAGYNSSDGSVFTFNVNERNFLGKGQTVDLALSSSSSERQMTFGLEDPSFQGRNLLVGVSFGRKTITPYYVPLNIDNSFLAPKIQFPLGRDSTLTTVYRMDSDKIKLSSASNATSPLITSEVGNKIKSSFILSYNLNKTNSVIKPSSGFIFEAKQEINGLGGDVKFFKTAFEVKTYRTFFRDDIILSSDISSGAIHGSDADISNRFSLGGDNLRGFRNYGIGPIDNTYSGSDANGDPLGGKMFAAINLEASFPIGIPEEYNVFGGLFIGAGSVWGLDNISSGSNIIDDSAKVRVAAGVSLFWDTVIGPLRFNFSRPIIKEDHDITENFRFTVDTRF